MTSDSNSNTGGKAISADAVARYLGEHPEFFVGRDELLRGMRIPHDSGGAISLLERQVQLLRDRNAELERRMDEFLANASANDTLFEKTRIIVLQLLQAGTLEELASILHRALGDNFGASESKLLFITDEDKDFPLDMRRSYDDARQALGELFERKRTFCGDVDSRQSKFLFPGSDKPIVSGAIVPVHIRAEEATARDFCAIPLLAIGSETPEHFNNRQDTLFLDFIGEVLSALLTRLR